MMWNKGRKITVMVMIAAVVSNERNCTVSVEIGKTHLLVVNTEGISTEIDRVLSKDSWKLKNNRQIIK